MAIGQNQGSVNHRFDLVNRQPSHSCAFLLKTPKLDTHHKIHGHGSKMEYLTAEPSTSFDRSFAMWDPSVDDAQVSTSSHGQR